MSTGYHRLALTFAALLLLAWIAFWLVSGRYAMLDDCLIHLRYADFLIKTHAITYDGVHRSFGTSSPLYVIVLALLRPVFSGPLLPKGLSIFLYLLLMSLLCVTLLRENRSSLARALLIVLASCLASPMGIRWLTDGMETPFHVLFAFLLALLADRESHSSSISIPRAAKLVLFGFLMATLRLESASLLFLVSLAIFVGRVLTSGSRKWNALLTSAPLASGAVFALLAIRLTLGAFLPDTALAKTGSPSLMPLWDSSLLLLHSLSLGIGLFLLWIVSAALLLRAVILASPPAPRLPVLALANAILPLTIALACIRGQFVQGVRYLLWCLVFSATWNILQISRLQPGRLPFRTHEAGRSAFPYRRAMLACAPLMLCLLFLEIHFVRPTLEGRCATFTQLRSAPLLRLHEDRIMSADVGYFGYFTGASICDVEGLVDGRRFASLSKSQRIRVCATSSPDVLFLNDFQLAEASAFINLRQWSVCRTFDFAGVSIRDRHYLMVPQAVASTKCPQLRGTATAYAPGMQVPITSSPM